MSFNAAHIRLWYQTNRQRFIKLIAVFLLVFIHNNGFAQNDSSFQLLQTIKTNAIDFAVDNLGNILLLSPGNQLKKISARGDSVAVFNDVRRYGKLSTIDVSNPLKALLYYKDFSTIVVLDRFLNIRNTIDLRKLGLLQVKAVGLSYDNNIWLYDELDAKLKKIGEDGTPLSEGIDFRLLFEEAPSPVQIIDQEGFVYLYDPARGLYAFDYYGALKNQYPTKDFTDVFVQGKQIFFRKLDTIIRYEPSKMKWLEYNLPLTLHDAIRIKISANRLFVQKAAGIQVYGYQ
jgi:hypothetical protein